MCVANVGAQPARARHRATSASVSGCACRARQQAVARQSVRVIEVAREIGVDLAGTRRSRSTRSIRRASTPSSRSAAEEVCPVFLERRGGCTARERPRDRRHSLSREQMLERFRARAIRSRRAIDVLAALLDVPEGRVPRIPRERSRQRTSRERAVLRMATGRTRRRNGRTRYADVREARAPHEFRARRLRRQGAPP